MKVFISHSSRDKWIAQRISKDLCEIRVETFLDAKDLEVGDELEDILDVHLETCDELMVLLSPTSVNSSWVLIEVGGARALKKRVVPILLHVGSNEIPSPISNKLAIDINNIDQYYEQIVARRDGREPVPAMTKPDTDYQISIGDIVKFKMSKGADFETPTSWITWEEQDNKYIGTTAKVIGIRDDGVLYIDSTPKGQVIAPTWVTVIEKSVV